MPRLHYKEGLTDKQRSSFAPYLAEDEELILVTGLGKTYLRSIFVIAMLWPGIIPFLIIIGLTKYLNLDVNLGFLAAVLSMVIVALLKTLHLSHANKYLLTTRRVIIKRGVFAVQLTSALYDKVTHIEVDQSFWDKVLMHHGTIKVNTAGMNKDEIVLRYVDYPIEFKNLLERLINRERELFSLRSGNIPTVEGELI